MWMVILRGVMFRGENGKVVSTQRHGIRGTAFGDGDT